jgi:ABC-2 type transport system ATP-binding protein
VLSELRSQHRILAWLNGPLPALPRELLGEESRVVQEGDLATIDSPCDLAPLLGWLAKLPLRDIRIEPVGLRTIYDRYHRPEQVAPSKDNDASQSAKAMPVAEEALR